MAGELILDTGALVTILDKRQNHHERFVRFFESWEAPIVSTEAVLTEATHLLGTVVGGREACIDFYLLGGALLVPATTAALRRSKEIVRQYADLPMDYADATLVVLAEELDTNLVFTTDRRDFAIYRIRGRRHFEILPR